MSVAALALTRADHALRGGALGRAGGVAVVDGLPDATIAGALVAEAWAAYAGASRQDCAAADHADGRGGVPPRALATASGAAVQDHLYRAPSLHSYLSDACGARIVPSGNRGSYSYYVAGDFLELHLDIPTCDLTLITVLDDRSPPTAPGGGLQVFPGAIGLPLRLVRARPDEGVVVKARPGQSILILGGLVPHRLLPLGAGQRVISALCFRAAV
jgi:hypothetical protein